MKQFGSRGSTDLPSISTFPGRADALTEAIKCEGEGHAKLFLCVFQARRGAEQKGNGYVTQARENIPRGRGDSSDAIWDAFGEKGKKRAITERRLIWNTHPPCDHLDHRGRGQDAKGVRFFVTG